MTSSDHRQGLLFIIIGPPGTGKNTLMNHVLVNTGNLSQLATATTRPPRDYEQHGREHLFVTLEFFERMIAAGDLLEWQQIHKTRRLYGIPRRTVEDAIAHGHDLIADIEVLGATYIRTLYPDNSVLIFIRPPSIQALEERMRARGDDEEEIAERMKRVPVELTYAPLCDHIILNDVVETAAANLLDIVTRERERHARGESGKPLIADTVIIPVYAGELLLPSDDARALRIPLKGGDIPHDIALNWLERTLQIATSADLLVRPSDSPFRGSFLPPSAIHVEERHDARKVTFTYLYTLPERITPPDGWAWGPYAEAHLEPVVAASIRAFIEPVSQP